jgi:steroid delta-isomerase-like uncharacterized protein
MPESDTLAITKRWLQEVWNERRDATVHELLDPKAVGHLEGLTVHGMDEFFKARAYLLDAFPDMRLSVDAMLAKGEDVIVRWSVQATHQGALLDVPPTGQAVAFHGITWFHFADGKLVEGWDVWNQGRLMAELRAVASRVDAASHH